MSNLEKLHKIILHASKNGFDFCKWKYENTDLLLMGMLEGNVQQLLKSSYWKLLLLDKEFAKCFFGNQEHNFIETNSEVEICNNCPAFLIPHEAGLDVDFCYEVHLQQLVLKDDLINYYYKFLEKK